MRENGGMEEHTQRKSQNKYNECRRKKKISSEGEEEWRESRIYAVYIKCNGKYITLDGRRRRKKKEITNE